MWYEKKGKDTDVVLSTKVTIMRNIKGFQFPAKMNDADRENAMGMMRQAAGNMGFNFIRCDEMDDNAKKDLYDQYYCKYAFLNDNKKTAFLLGQKEGLGVTLNDREHMAIESFVPGSDAVSAYKAAEEVAVNFEKNMEIAYSDKMGFLTSDIKYVGTGLQISFLVAIPGIEKTAGALMILSKRAEKYDWVISPILQADGNKENGMFEIKSIAREAGSRTKIAVYSNDPKVDAVGACVGVNGIRVNNIVDELRGEKIDIINWDENPGNLIQNALSPAKIVAVFADPEEKTAKVVVPDYQLSLAIGREGQNARLAAKLTGYKIDIKSETQAKDAPGFRYEDYEDEYYEDDEYDDEYQDEEEYSEDAEYSEEEYSDEEEMAYESDDADESAGENETEE